MYVCATSYRSVDECLAHFYILAIVDNAAMNIGCMYLFECSVCFLFFFFSDIYPGAE